MHLLSSAPWLTFGYCCVATVAAENGAIPLLRPKRSEMKATCQLDIEYSPLKPYRSRLNNAQVNHISSVPECGSDCTDGSRQCSNSTRLSVWSSQHVYANANKAMDEKYWNYQAMVTKYGNIKNYKILKKIGRGKYSNAFEGVDECRNKKIVIKVLKPVIEDKVKREIKVLQNLKGGPNIVKIIDVVIDCETRTHSIIFDHMKSAHSSIFRMMNIEGIKYYMYELLRALDYSHSKGIMHRDVKPANIIINNETKRLRLIDWGLAEFYHPQKAYHCSVASRPFKAPELLIDFQHYDYSIDMWATGCILAGMLFRKDHFFSSVDNDDQLEKIVDLLGTQELKEYVDRLKLRSKKISKVLAKEKQRKSWKQFATPENSNVCNDRDALDLLNKLLIFDHSKRFSAKDAMNHRFFQSIDQR